MIKSPLDNLFEKENGGGVKGCKEEKSRRYEVYLEGCIYAVLQIYRSYVQWA
jgi:hypothetical protein